MVDLIPGLSVGRALFLVGKSRIKNWLKQFPGQTVSCIGQSLGGSLSIFTAEAFQSQTKAYAHVPAGRLFYKMLTPQKPSAAQQEQIQSALEQSFGKDLSIDDFYS